MKKIIRLTESDLHRIVKESVKRIISEKVLRDRPTPEQLENPKVPRNQKMKRDPGAVERWKENFRRTYTDPEYFATLLKRDENFRSALYSWGVQWVEDLFPGNEMLKQVAQEELHKISVQRAIRDKKEAERRRRGPVYSNPYTPFFDSDMGWH